MALATLGCGGPPPTYRDVVVDHSDRPVGELVAGGSVEQTFVPNHDNLTGVAVFLATYGNRARTCRVLFALRAESSKNDIVRAHRECSALADNAWARFDFAPLPGTKDQHLVFRIESRNGRPGDAITAWMSSVPGIYPEGRLTIDGVSTPGALRFVTFHR